MTLQSDMKKNNDSTSIGSDARANLNAEDPVKSDSSLDAKAESASSANELIGTPISDAVKPKLSKKSKLKPKLDSSSIKGKKKLSSQSITTANRTADVDYSFTDSADEPAAFSSSRYQMTGQNSDRIAIFIDGSNLFYAASHLNIEVDYRRLLTTLVGERRLLRAYFYTGVDPQNEKQRGFLLWLNRHGHRVVSKELTSMPDGSRKANMHVEMAVDMMRISEHCSTITLLGGDGNLAYALDALSRQGISIEVVSLQSMTSDSLIDLADSYVDLADLKDEIKR